jgi:hypothetical protein
MTRIASPLLAEIVLLVKAKKSRHTAAFPCDQVRMAPAASSGVAYYPVTELQIFDVNARQRNHRCVR